MHCYCAFSLCLPLAGSRVSNAWSRAQCERQIGTTVFVLGAQDPNIRRLDLQDIVSSALTEAVGLYRLCIILLVQCCGPQDEVLGRCVYGFWRTVLAFSGAYALYCHCA